MNSNDSHSPFRPRPPKRPWNHQLPPRPHVQEDILKTVGFQIERKVFILQLRENSRGRFLRITEQGGNNTTSIIVPCGGMNDFRTLLAEMVKAAEALPSKQ